MSKNKGDRMRISLIKDDMIKTLLLPKRPFGNFWITDLDANGNEFNTVNIEAIDGKWNLISNDEFYCVEGSKRQTSKQLDKFHFYNVINATNEELMHIYVSDVYNMDTMYYSYAQFINREFKIGKAENCEIQYQLAVLDDIQCKLVYTDELGFAIYLPQSSVKIYINNYRIKESQRLNSGDTIFVLGLKIVVLTLNGKPYIAVDGPSSAIKCVLPRVELTGGSKPFVEPDEEHDIPLYTDEDYFHKKPRFTTKIIELALTVDPPPNKEEQPEMPLFLTIGPMVTMSMTSLVMAWVAISNVAGGNAPWTRAAPGIAIAIAMIGSVILWPSLTKKHQKKKRKEREEERQQKYRAYINERLIRIQEEIRVQENILVNTYPKIAECQNVILNKYTNLWERRIEDDDFMTISLGTGDAPMKVNINFPEDRFSMAEDDLKSMVSEVAAAPKILKNVPIVFSLLEENISGIIGGEVGRRNLINNILLQLLTFHCYSDLKIVLFTDKAKEHQWEFLKVLPHNWNNDKTFRFFASSSDEYKEVCHQLDKVFSHRKEESGTTTARSPHAYNQIYLIITDSFRAIRNFDFIANVLKTKENYGFSILMLTDNMASLPDQCKSFMTVMKDSGQLFKSVLGKETQPFVFDECKIDIEKCSEILANIPVEITDAGEGQLPNQIGFLELYDIGKVEQLNCLNRWEKNTPILNMQAPIGVGKSGEKISLDLHEKFHGPHGLIAGMTGSGKSEFIITYILSMSICYHPHEVQFILIDYKGGGLAGAFENATLGLKLPHLVGTITNLDANEVNRSLASIESELKRRQRAFNVAREASGESTVDIYKYQRMYREKVVDEPVSHLFIVADEFAELKVQQPEFMAQLISTARIGRSLGVHLILATQKPSGVVDPQIWSNTRFRVCLRVQEKADSSEVIKCPDAAFLKQTGRFYLQVGFNEIFLLGQSAWAGGKYFPSEKIRKTLDTSVEAIDNIANPLINIETKKKSENVQAQGEELLNILEYLSKIADEMSIKSRPLWLEKIPDFIKVEDLITKYNYTPEKFVLNLLVGEYDVPSMQEQRPLMLPISNEGNTLVYGSSGSGKENFIMTTMYSAMISHTPEEVNFYVLDFGTEAMKCFNSAPHLGDIAYIDDAEKIKNLFKKLNELIEERKKLFAPYNGDGTNYIKNSGKTLPNIVVIINNYEAFNETYPDCEEDMLSVSRDCSRYHIYFIMAVNTANGVRFKLRQNFAQVYALQQNNDDDYTTILGSVKRMYPSRIFGRGIFRLENIYEFQTAMIEEKDQIPNAVKTKSDELAAKYPVKALSIPILPEVVSHKEVEKHFSDITGEVIIGMTKSTLQPIKHNLKKSFTTIISAMDPEDIKAMLQPFLNQIMDRFTKKLIVIDCENLDLEGGKYQYITNNYDHSFGFIHKLIIDNNEIYKNNNSNNNVFANMDPYHVVIIGVDNFKNKLSDENKLKFGEIFEKAKELGIISYTLIDGVDRIKKYELEQWYKNMVDANQAIWLGNGINDQFSIKLAQRPPECKQEIPHNYGFFVQKGKPVLMKYVEIYDSKQEDTTVNVIPPPIEIAVTPQEVLEDNSTELEEQIETNN